MSDYQGYPPPGAPPPPGSPPPPGPPPGWAATPGPYAAPVARTAPPGWTPAPGMLGAAHKPGAMPLRPLGLGDMYDAAFRIIRFNPKATVGSAVLVAAVTMLIPVLVTGILTWTIGAAYDQTGGTGSGTTDEELIGTAGSFGSLGLGAVLQILGLLLVTGMIVHVTAAAAVGKRLSLGEAWRATHGKRWRLIGLSALLWLMSVVLIGVLVLALVAAILPLDGLVIVPVVMVWIVVFLAALFFFWIRVYYLAVPALMLEPIGIFASIGRAWHLTRRQFWRTFGIALLTYLVAQIAGSILAFPIALLSQLVVLAVDAEYALFALVISQALSSVVAAAFVAPFSSAVSSLQYIDQRMRKEAYDVELMTRAGLTAS